MRSENTFGVLFSIRQNKNKRKDYSVFAKISCNGSPEREITIKGRFDPKNWDDNKGWPHLYTKELREFATYLQKVEGKLSAIFQDLELNEGILTADNIKNHYLGRGDAIERVTMLELTKRRNQLAICSN